MDQKKGRIFCQKKLDDILDFFPQHPHTFLIKKGKIDKRHFPVNFISSVGSYKILWKKRKFISEDFFLFSLSAIDNNWGKERNPTKIKVSERSCTCSNFSFFYVCSSAVKKRVSEIFFPIKWSWIGCLFYSPPKKKKGPIFFLFFFCSSSHLLIMQKFFHHSLKWSWIFSYRVLLKKRGFINNVN